MATDEPLRADSTDREPTLQEQIDRLKERMQLVDDRTITMSCVQSDRFELYGRLFKRLCSWLYSNVARSEAFPELSNMVDEDLKAHTLKKQGPSAPGFEIPCHAEMQDGPCHEGCGRRGGSSGEGRTTDRC